MKKITFLLFTLLSLTLNAQKIEYSNDNFFKNYFYKQKGKNEYLKIKDIETIVRTNSEALALVKKGKKLDIISYVPLLTGSALTGITISQLISSDKEINWTQAGIGVGLIGISIPISKKATKNIIKGIDKYNSSYKSETNDKVELNLIGDFDSLCFIINF